MRAWFSLLAGGASKPENTVLRVEVAPRPVGDSGRPLRRSDAEIRMGTVRYILDDTLDDRRVADGCRYSWEPAARRIEGVVLSRVWGILNRVDQDPQREIGSGSMDPTAGHAMSVRSSWLWP